MADPLIASLDTTRIPAGSAACSVCERGAEHACHGCGLAFCRAHWRAHCGVGHPPGTRLWERTATPVKPEPGVVIEFTGVCPEPNGPCAWGWAWNDRATGELRSGGGGTPGKAGNSGLTACLNGLWCGLKSAAERGAHGRRPGVRLQTDNAVAVELMNGAADVGEALAGGWDRTITLLVPVAGGGGVDVQLVTGEEISLAIRNAGEWWERGQQRRQGQPTPEAA